MNRRNLVLGLAAFWLVACCGYVAAARRQQISLNLSPTAGGQMPYLVYARHVAQEGLLGHFGDRNRMPLIPVLASMVHHSDWETFFAQARWFAVFSSLLLLGAMAAVAYGNLSAWAATAFVLIIAGTVFGPQASFLQADVAYYALFFCSWWQMCRLIERPALPRAAWTGLLLAVTYLAKASILIAVPILLALLMIRGAVSLCSAPPQRGAALRAAGAGALVVAVFLAILFPYLRNNHERFGRYFYNVNTTFFMWCDSWPHAQRFAEQYAIDQHSPTAPAEALPGPLNYLRTHSPAHITGRLAYGLRTLTSLTVRTRYFKYVLLFSVGSLALAATFRAPALAILREHRWSLSFTLLTLGAYVLAYSWYVVVAYGDRFVLSLAAPVLFGLLWYLDRAWYRVAPSRLKFAVGPALVLFALVDAALAAATTWVRPSATFVQFYFDESREEMLRGNLGEAMRGFRGVLQLDPAFAPAHRDLGMIALHTGRPQDAIAPLREAARLEPGWADVHNSLGSALIQSGRPGEAVEALERATTLDPDWGPAWYNLCGTYHQMGELEKARKCLQTLRALSPELADPLEKILQPQAGP